MTDREAYARGPDSGRVSFIKELQRIVGIDLQGALRYIDDSAFPVHMLSGTWGFRPDTLPVVERPRFSPEQRALAYTGLD